MVRNIQRILVGKTTYERVRRLVRGKLWGRRWIQLAEGGVVWQTLHVAMLNIRVLILANWLMQMRSCNHSRIYTCITIKVKVSK